MRIQSKEAIACYGNVNGRKVIAELLEAGLDALGPYCRVKGAYTCVAGALPA